MTVAATGEATHVGAVNLESLAPRVAALGNPTRLAVYRILVRAGAPGLPVAAVRERVDVPASTLSHHLRALRDVGLVRQERQGTSLICRADFEVMRTTFAWLEQECCVDAVCDPSPGTSKRRRPSGARSDR